MEYTKLKTLIDIKEFERLIPNLIEENISLFVWHNEWEIYKTGPEYKVPEIYKHIHECYNEVVPEAILEAMKKGQDIEYFQTFLPNEISENSRHWHPFLSDGGFYNSTPEKAFGVEALYINSLDKERVLHLKELQANLTDKPYEYAKDFSFVRFKGEAISLNSKQALILQLLFNKAKPLTQNEIFAELNKDGENDYYISKVFQGSPSGSDKIRSLIEFHNQEGKPSERAFSSKLTPENSKLI